MYQNERGAYRKKESLPLMFWHTCLGKFVCACAVLGLLGFIAHLTRPSEEKMRAEITDDIRQNIESRDSLNTDWIDDAVANVGHTFTHADSAAYNKELMERFLLTNQLVYFERFFYSSMHIYNSFRPEGERCGLGIFGMVIPLVNFNDYLLRDGMLRREYNEPIIQQVGQDEYFGENPDLGGIFRYNGE